MKVLCIILGILLGLCLIGTAGLYLYFRRELKRWKNTADDNLRAGKEEAADIIRRTMDTVSAEKERMAALPEKTILIEAMTALAAQSRRLDRMEEKMEIVVSYTDTIDALNKTVETINADLSALQAQFKDASTLVVTARQAVQGLNTSVAQFNTTLGNTEGVQKQLAQMTDHARQTFKQIEGLDAKANTVVSDTAKLFAAHNGGPMERLAALENQLKSIEQMNVTLQQKLDSVNSALQVRTTE